MQIDLVDTRHIHGDVACVAEEDSARRIAQLGEHVKRFRSCTTEEVQHIGFTRPTFNNVATIAWLPNNGIGTSTAMELIVARIIRDAVTDSRCIAEWSLPIFTEQLIIVASTDKDIVTAPTVDQVDVGATDDRIIAIATIDHWIGWIDSYTQQVDRVIARTSIMTFFSPVSARSRSMLSLPSFVLMFS